MKILSDNAVTKADLTAVDQKQDKQITQLRIALAVSFIVNVALSIGLKFI